MRLISGLLRSALASPVAGLRDAVTGLAILSLAVGILFLAIAFGLLAAFWALTEMMQPWQAALLIAGIALLVALILRLVGLRYFGRRRADRLAADELSKQAADMLALTKKEFQTTDSLTLVALAVLAGVVVGRRMWK